MTDNGFIWSGLDCFDGDDCKFVFSCSKALAGDGVLCGIDIVGFLTGNG